MSIEDKIEEYRFNQSLYENELDKRVSKIKDRAKELKENVKDYRAYFNELKNNAYKLRKDKNPSKKELKAEVDEAAALVYLICEENVGRDWQILGEDYTWDMIPRDVQIKAGLVLCDGKYSPLNWADNRFARARTGEGKTLMSLFPIVYHAMLGPMHIVTSNDYLASRDRDWIGPILNCFGVSSSYLPKKEEEKRAAYEHDVVFGSDKELSFDFLRDSIMSPELEQLCENREYILVDEADFVMLDELNTPIILSTIIDDKDSFVTPSGEIVKELVDLQKEYIDNVIADIDSGKEYEDPKDYFRDLARIKSSGVAKDWTTKFFSENPKLESKIKNFETNYLKGKEFIKHIEQVLYFTSDINKKTSSFTENGMSYIETSHKFFDKVFDLPDYDQMKKTIEDSEINKPDKKRKLKEFSNKALGHLHLIASLNNALRAHVSLEKDVDYIIKDDKIELVTTSIGRADPHKKYQHGVSQALEFKEGVEQTNSDIVVTGTTFPGLLTAYKKILAMSGTILPNQKELKKIYNMESFDIPTFTPPIVVHYSTELHKTKEDKRKSILKDLMFNHTLGRPILLGSSSIQASEAMAKLLEESGLEYDLLNAKNEAEEAKIIANANRLEAITISTNMAGRGIDIRPDDEINRVVSERYSLFIKNSLPDIKNLKITCYSDPEYEMLNKALHDKGIETKVKKKGDRHILTVKGPGKDNSSVDFNAGMYVLGEEMGESKRVDDQLRGRTGRQGDPGSSRFYACLEDPLMTGSGEAFLLGRIGLKLAEKGGLRGKFGDYLKRASLKLAQTTGEKTAEYARQDNLFHGAIMERQRKLKHQFRDELKKVSLEDIVPQFMDDVLKKIVKDSFKQQYVQTDEVDNFKYKVETTFNTSLEVFNSQFNETERDIIPPEEFKDMVKEHLVDLYNKRTNALENEDIDNFRMHALSSLDRNWYVQMDLLEDLKKRANINSHAGKKPEGIYAKLSNKSFIQFKDLVKKDLLKDFFGMNLTHEENEKKDTRRRIFNDGVSEELEELLS